MPQKITRLNVFISSPANLETERRTIAKVLESLNSEISDEGIIFEVFDWKRDAIPGVGSDPQAVVTSQLEYDIYIGLLGSVFGTPTAHAGSGTEEEFTDAYKRYGTDPKSVRILFYFKTASENIFQIIPEELSRVHIFRSSLGPKGVLYQDFEDLDSLRDNLRAHLLKLVRSQWDGEAWRILSPLPPMESTSIQSSPTHEEPKHDQCELLVDSEDEDRLGMLEFVIIGKAAGQQFGEHLQRMSASSIKFNQSTNSWTSRASLINMSNDPEKAKELIDGFAEDMRTFQMEMQVELPIYRTTSSEIIRSLKGVVEIYFEEQTGSREEAESITSSFEKLATTLRGVRGVVQKFRDTIDKFPSFTMAFRAARKHLSSVLDEFISSYTIFLGAADGLTLEIRQQLDRAPQGK